MRNDAWRCRPWLCWWWLSFGIHNAFVQSVSVHDVSVTISGSDALPVTSIQQMVRVEGCHARVLVDVIVSYERDVVSEGTFRIDLPTGASPWMIGFGHVETTERSDESWLLVEYDDVVDWTSEAMAELRGEHFKAGRMAGRAVASQSFTEVVNRGVDPAILEGGGAGSFSTRVFPFVPHQTQYRITLGYDIAMVYEFVEDGRGGHRPRLRYNLPIPASADENDHPDIQTRVEMMVSQEPVFLTNNVDYSVIRKDSLSHMRMFLNGNDRSYQLTFPQNQTAPEASSNSTLRVFTAPLAWGVVEGVHHFDTRFHIPSISSSTEERTQSHVVLAVESSFHSAHDGSMTRYREIVQAVLENDPSIEWFNLMLFDVGVQWLDHEWLANNPANRIMATEWLESVLPEGATDVYSALTEIIKKSNPPFDLFLMSSASVTWGESDPNRIVALLSDQQNVPRRVHTFHVGSVGGDPTLLRRLAQTRGGVFTSIPNQTLSPEQATRHLQPRIALRSVTVQGAEDVVVAGGSPSADHNNPLLVISPGQNVRVAWRATHDEARTLRIQFVGGETIVVELTLPSTGPTDVGVRAYGVLANEELEQLLPLSEEASRKVALYYRVVGRTASLVMLDTEQDYQRYAIQPSHPFASVRDVGPEQLRTQLQRRATQSARSPYRGLIGFLDKIQATGLRLAWPEQVTDLLYGVGLSDASVDIASRTRREDLTLDRTQAIRRSQTLQEQLKKGHEATYDAWTEEANLRRSQSSPLDALRALTSLLAQQPADHVLLRDVALSAVELGFPSGAYSALARVAESRPWEPMSYLQMAQTSQRAALPDLALVWFEVSLAGDWPTRFKAFREVSGMLYARHLRHMNEGKTTWSEPSNANVQVWAQTREPEIRAWFTAATRAGLVVFLTWNQDNTDIDLHVTEPSGETCKFDNALTKSGGRLFGDVTSGYGPELYVQEDWKNRGTYDIDVGVFSVNPNRLGAPIKVLVEVFTSWGFANEDYQAFTAVGRESDTILPIASVVVKDPVGQIPITVAVGDKPPDQDYPTPELIGLIGSTDVMSDVEAALDERVAHDASSTAYEPNSTKSRGGLVLSCVLIFLSLWLTSA